MTEFVSVFIFILTTRMAARVSHLCFRMIVSMTYYGVIMNSGNLAGDFYLNFFLMALAEIPGLLIGLFVLDKIGRRYSNSGSMCIGGFACICTIFTVLYGGKGILLKRGSRKFHQGVSEKFLAINIFHSGL